MKNYTLKNTKFKKICILFIYFYGAIILSANAQVECFSSVDPPVTHLNYFTINNYYSPVYGQQYSSTFGQWMSDSKEKLGAGKIWVMPGFDNYYSGEGKIIEYNSLSDLKNNIVASSWILPVPFDGTGAVVYDGYLYYNKSNSNHMIKYDLKNRVILLDVPLPNAGFRNQYHYQWGGWSDIDFEVDETGLWVMYSTMSNSGKLVVSKLNPANLSIIQTWNTSTSYKTAIGNAFIICGVVYGTASYGDPSTTINYKYDTKTSTGSTVSIPFDQSIYGSSPYVTQISYNPNEGKLYTWNNGRLQTYNINFNTSTISTSSIVSNPLCVSSSYNIPFTANGTFNSGNIFTAQLSDASGSFTTPTSIGTLASTTSGTINATIPSNTPSGTGYRIRVVSSAPAVTGTDNGSDITINALPTATLSGDGAICPGGSANLSVALTGTGPWSVTYTDDTTPVTVSAETSPLIISVSPESNTTYTLTEVSDANCTGTVDGSATVTINDLPTATLSGGGSICPDGSSDLSVALTGTGPWSVTYTDGTTPVTVAAEASPFVIPVSPGSTTTYSLVGVSDANCTGISVSGTATVTVNAPPVVSVPTISAVNSAAGQCGATVEFEATATGTPAPGITYKIGETEIASPYFFPVGTTTVTATAMNDCGEDVQTFTVTVKDSEAPTLVGLPGNIEQGTDADKCGAVVTWTAPTATDNCSGAGLITSHEPGSVFPVGTTTVTYTATDAAGNSTPGSFDVIITDSTPPVLAAAPAPITVYTGAGATTCTATATWAPLTATENCGGVTVTSTHEPGAVFPIGETTVTYTATDDAGNESQSSFKVTVIDNTSPIITAPAPITQGTDAGVCNAVISNLGTPVYADNCVGANVSNNAPAVFPKGETLVTWTVEDAAGNTAIATQLVTVIDDEDPVLSLPANFTVSNETGTCGAAVNFAPTALDYCDGSIAVSTDYDSGFTFPVGTTTVNVTATDATGNIATGSFTVTVTNVAPVLNTIASAIDPVQIGSNVSASATFTDTNLLSATWNWGDGSTSTGAIDDQSITGSHTYTTTGVYTVGLTIKDACGISATTTYQYVVVYDPSGGFVTGGGWIYSPAGAYKTDPLLTGKANFGFVSKYQKGATVPTGNTNFEFQVANLQFQSTSYEWLVISGATARYKGEGTINGSGWYGFTLAATDGQINGDGNIDKFRIKIWDKNDGDKIVYDNNSIINSGDDALAETVIGGGSIVVHDGKQPTAKNTSKSVAETAGTSFYSYPTAFSDKTTIAFTLDREEDYVLEVFDMRGALVKKLAGGSAAANKLYEFELRSDGMAEGLFITRLTTSSTVKSLKVVLKR